MSLPLPRSHWYMLGTTDLAEIHTLYTLATQRRTYRGRGRSLPGAHYQFDNLLLR